MRLGANEQGGWDVGCLPNRLPGYGWVSEEADRQAVEAVWGALLPEEPGLGLARMVKAARDGQLSAAVVIGNSPNFSNGRLGDAIADLAKADFLVVHDTFLTPLAQRADVVLPRVTFVEKSGTYTNLERRVQLLKRGLSKDDDSQPEGWVFTELGERIRPGTLPEMTPAQTFDEIAQVASIYGGISHGRLEKEGSLVLRTQPDSPQPTQVLYASRQHRGLQWPCPDAEHPGTQTLYSGGFEQRKAEPLTPAFNLPVPEASAEFPLWFAPGRVLLQQHREMDIIKGKRNRIQREEWVELSPSYAAANGLAEGDKVRVETTAGLVPGVVRFNTGLPHGVVASTALFGQLAIDMEASQEFDPAPLLEGLEVRPARLVKG